MAVLSGLPDVFHSIFMSWKEWLAKMSVHFVIKYCSYQSVLLLSSDISFSSLSLTVTLGPKRIITCSSSCNDFTEISWRFPAYIAYYFFIIWLLGFMPQFFFLMKLFLYLFVAFHYILYSSGLATHAI